MIPPCTRCGSELALGDLRCPICALVTPPVSVKGMPQGDTARVFRCQGCGAAVTYDIQAQAPVCGFCRAVVALETQADPLEEAEYFPAFGVDLAMARAALEAWWRVPRFFCPGALSSSAMVEDLRPLRWVAWVFDVEATVSWAADSNADSRRSDWAPHSGQFEEQYKDVVVSASRGLTQSETRQLAPHYASDHVFAPNPDLAMESTALGKSVVVERFNVQRSAARKLTSLSLQALAEQSAARRVPGTRMRNLRVEVVPRRLVTRRVAFPVYVAAYRYNGKLFRAIVHGRKEGFVIGGTPIAWSKVVLLVLIALALLAALIVSVSGAD